MAWAAAREACEGVVAERLDDAASNDFFRSDAASTDRIYGEGTWMVFGQVDTADAAGEVTRLQYVCRMRGLGGDAWRADSVTIEE